MPIVLRDSYQVPAYEATRALVRSGKRRILVQMPTGAGKTAWAAYLLQRAVEKGATAQFWVHRRELIRQSVLCLADAGVETGIIAAGFAPNRNAPVQVCSVQSLRRRIDKIPEPDLLICDEIHHAPAATWDIMLAHYAKAVRIGLSATPWRLTGEGLRPWFDEMIIGPSTAELIQEGWLSPYRLFAPGHLDLSGVHTVAGDYNQKELAEKMKRSAVTGDCLSHYQKYVPGKRALIFMWSVESSIDMARQFNDAGIPAAHIDGTTDDRIRDRAIQMFESGEIRVLSNVNIASEGLNIPGIEALFLLRPTQSLTLYLQAIGRALRPFPGKQEAWIFDHAGNVRRHGLPDDPRDWSLDGEPKKHKTKEEKEDRVRVCPQCERAHGMHVRVCDCGYVLVQSLELDVDAEAELTEVRAAAIREERFRQQGLAKDIDALTEVGRKRGFAHPRLWASHVIRAREEKKAARARRLIQEPNLIVGGDKAIEDRWMF